MVLGSRPNEDDIGMLKLPWTMAGGLIGNMRQFCIKQTELIPVIPFYAEMQRIRETKL